MLHEYLACEGAGPAGRLPLVYRMHFDGARRRDPKTYGRDAEVLERALKTESDPALRSRYTFYLAQSHRDAGDQKKALRHYVASAGQGGWADHVYVSLLEAARLTEALKARDRDVVAAYERAAAAAPERAEALHGLARYCREQKLYAEGYGYARAGFKIPLPAGGLFVEPWIYAWGMLDELSVNAYWTGRYQESLDTCRALLANPKFRPNTAHASGRTSDTRRPRSGSDRRCMPLAAGAGRTRTKGILPFGDALASGFSPTTACGR